jgi:hypothetical protein
MRVLVCGGRDFDNVAFIWSKLNKLHAETPFTAMIHGGQTGADEIANEWAKTKSAIVRYSCKADWDRYGRAAGPMRNMRMLEWKPNMVVAFPGGNGTADMVQRARKAAIKVIEFS